MYDTWWKMTDAASTMARLNYANKVILAPMVRIGTLPTRLLALKYGADIVYCEELIDHRMLQCKRVINPILDTVDFIHADGRCMFRTRQAEKEKVIFQMGTADPERAVKTAKLVERDVAGIDVNMGCPKDFSLKGGMGAALLKQPDRVKEILTALVQSVSKPVTCKIRILPSLEETLKLVRVIEGTGVAAVGVHGRYQTERSQHPCHHDIIREVTKAVSTPVIANGGSGDIATYEDIDIFKKKTGCSSVMVARAAQWNPSVFRKEGPLPIDDVIKDYVKLAVDFDNYHSNSKYCLAQLLHDNMDSPEGKALLASNTMKELCEIWKMVPYLEEVEERRKEKIDQLSLQEQKDLGVASFCPTAAKRRKLDIEMSEDGVIELFVKFSRKDYFGDKTPKSVVLEHARRLRMNQPVYDTIERSKDRMFKSVLTLGDERYSSSYWATSKRFAEQAAAIVALAVLGVDLQPVVRT